METRALVRQIAKFHKNYEKEFLEEKIKNKTYFLKSSKDALFFILSYSFYQGRRDEISLKFEQRAKEVLDLFLKNDKVLLSSSSRMIDKNKLKINYRELYDLLKQKEVNKEADRLMVVSLVNFIQSNNEKNILCFLINKIKLKEIAEAYKDLDGIWSIGPKIASLVLRDIICIYNFEKYLNENDYPFLQPIDTWVHQLSKEVGLISKEKIYKNEAKDITDKCLELKTNPIHYNEGAWYIGSNSLKILLKNIDKIG